MKSNQNAPYLVTGAAGFIGARFIQSCNIRGIPVISVDEPQFFKNRLEHQGTDFGQIVDKDQLWTWLSQQAPHLKGIIHLGAITDTREFDLAKLKKQNIEYSQNLWNYTSQHGIPFIYASSAATYGDGHLGYDDDESIIPQLTALNPYGDSKQKFDCWALNQEKQGNHPPTWSGYKFFNVYGFGERHKEFMSSVILQAFDKIKATGEMTLFRSHKPGIEDGHQKRDFISVEDVVEGLHFGIEKPVRRGIYNLGTGKARTFLDLVRAVFQAMNQPEKIRFIDTPEIIRDKYQYFTEARMDRFVSQGYSRPFRTLEQGVSEYVQKLMTTSF